MAWSVGPRTKQASMAPDEATLRARARYFSSSARDSTNRSEMGGTDPLDSASSVGAQFRSMAETELRSSGSPSSAACARTASDEASLEISSDDLGSCCCPEADDGSWGGRPTMSVPAWICWACWATRSRLLRAIRAGRGFSWCLYLLAPSSASENPAAVSLSIRESNAWYALSSDL